MRKTFCITLIALLLPLSAQAFMLGGWDSFKVITSGGLDFTNVGSVTIKSGSVLLLPDGTVSAPSLAFTDSPTTGIYSVSANQISFATSGAARMHLSGSGFAANTTNGPFFLNENATATNPTLIPDRGDVDTGLGAAAAGGSEDQLSLIAGGVEGWRITEDTTIKHTVTGEVQGVTFSDQHTYNVTGTLLGELTDVRLVLNWTDTVSDNGSCTDFSAGSGETCTFTDASDWAAADQLFKGFGYTLDFDGTDDLVTITDSANLTFDDSGAEPVSICAWAEVIATAGVQTLVSKHDTGSTVREYKYYIDADEKLNLLVYDEANDKSSLLTSNAALTVGWRHLCVAYDGTGGANALAGGNALLYVDGAVIADADGGSDPANYVNMTDQATALTVGAELNSGSGANFMTGDMGAMYITGEELSAADIWRLYMQERGLYAL